MDESLAIICGSASTFRALIKRYIPGLLGSTRYGTGDHPYNHSSTGDFALKPYGAGRSNQLSRDKPSVGHGLYADNMSDEAVPVRTGSQKSVPKKGIMMNTEFTMKVTDADPSSQRQVAPYSQV